MKRNSVHFLSPLLSISLFFSPSKKKRHRIKRERSVMATKIMHGVPIHRQIHYLYFPLFWFMLDIWYWKMEWCHSCSILSSSCQREPGISTTPIVLVDVFLSVLYICVVVLLSLQVHSCHILTIWEIFVWHEKNTSIKKWQ